MTQSSRKKRTRKDLRIAERAINKNIVQLPAFARELWKPHRYKILWGGRGGARSWSVARTLLLKAAQSKLRILCAREMQSSLRDSVHQLLRDQIDLMKLPGFIVTDREIRHINGSLFIFMGIRHNAHTIKSLEGVDICWVEEAERITKESWSILIPTIRKAGSEIWVTFNPDAETDATYTRFILKSPADCWQRKVGWEDNPWLTPELRAEKDYMYETDIEAADHVWGGNIRKHSAAQILKDKWVVREFTVDLDESGYPIDESWHGPYFGMDFGFGADPFATIKCWVKGRVLFIENEVYGHKIEVDEIPEAVLAVMPEAAEYVIRADSSRPDSISYVKRKGLSRTEGAKKGPGSVEDGIAHLRSYEQIVVHPRCIHTRDECKLWSYKVDPRSEDILPIVVDKHNHLMDALRYALEPMIKPRTRAGFIFIGTEKIRTCPKCESMLPDDGECVHCGFDENEHEMEEDLVGAAAIVETVVPVQTIQQRVRELTTPKNGNGNGHTNGNGNGHAPPKTTLRMRDLNS